MQGLSRIILRIPSKGTACFRPTKLTTSPLVATQTIKKYSTSTAPSVSTQGEWLHKLDYYQEIFYWGHRAGTRFTTQCYTFNSRKPLSYDVVYKALMHVTKRTPAFQIVVREKDGELWWYKGNEVKVDFKFHNQGELKYEVLHDLWNTNFDEKNGPLWRTCLLEAGADDNSVDPEIKKVYPHQYYFFSFPHHALIDGQSCAIISQPILDTLNAVIQGEDVDDSKQIGEYVSNVNYINADATLKEKLSRDPEILEAKKEKFLKLNKEPLLFKAFPRPVVDTAMSKDIFVDVEPTVLGKFLENCKNKGLTYGNSLETVTNTALVEMVQEAGVVQDYYDISVITTIDTRRYLEKTTLPMLGLHARPIVSMFTMEKSPRMKFWENCTNLQRINKEHLKAGAAFEQQVISQQFLPLTPAVEYFKTRPPLTRDYGFNNVGSIERAIPGHGKHVQITHVISYHGAHRFSTPLYQQLFTYRGKDINMFSYATDCIKDETASLLVDKIKSIITHFGN